MTADEKEHIAGPGCTCTAGYSGHRISVEEMKVSTREHRSSATVTYLAQDIKSCIALLKKPPKWKPEEGDEDFEKEAFSCFLTGISRHVSEFDMDDIHPARHGVNSTMVENFIMGSNVSELAHQDLWLMEGGSSDLMVCVHVGEVLVRHVVPGGVGDAHASEVFRGLQEGQREEVREGRSGWTIPAERCTCACSLLEHPEGTLTDHRTGDDG